jgi:NAD(P)-dependent dehydrogenase (short-subunit alcohol dehydrogenase family)
MPHGPVYAAAKAGVVNFTRSLAYLAAECNVRVNAVCPSYADTPLIYRDGNEEMVAVMKERLGGLVQPADVAQGVLELVEDDSRAGAIMRVTVRNGRDFAREIRG